MDSAFGMKYKKKSIHKIPIFQRSGNVLGENFAEKFNHKIEKYANRKSDRSYCTMA